jgi:hypothetical protein
VSGVRVDALAYADGHVKGIYLSDGTLVHATPVVLAVAPRDALKVVGTASPALQKAVDGLVPSHVACFDVALRHLPDRRHAVVQDLDGPRFFSTQSVLARIAPRDGALIHAFKQLDPRQPNDPHSRERDLEDLLDTAQAGWREVVVKRISLPHIEAVSAFPLASRGGFAGRVGPRVPGLGNLYLAGDWIGPVGFLSDASFASARDAAQMVLQSCEARGASPICAQRRPHRPGRLAYQ